MIVIFSHHSLRLCMVPVAWASSAYHTWKISPVDRCMSGRMPRAYIGIASGSPRVVHSLEKMMVSWTNNSVAAWYVLIRIVAKGGHRI